MNILLQGQQTPQLLSKDFIQEALIISDLFDLNEFAAVELLIAGEFPLQLGTFFLLESCLFFSGKPAAVLPRVDARLGGSFVVLRRPGKSSERTSHSPAVSRWPHMDHVTSGRTQRTCHQVH